MKHKWIILFLITLGSGAFAQEMITVEKAVDLALENNLSLKQASIDVRLKERAKDTVWNRFLPQLSVNSGLVRMNTAPEIPGPGGATELNPWSLSAGWDASLAINLSLFRGIKQTVIDYETSQISYSKARADLTRQVKKNFYSLILLQKQMEVQEKGLQSARDRYDQAQINFEAGLVPELTVLSAQVAYENQKPAIDNMRIGYQSALMGFKFLLGIDIEAEIDLEGDFNSFPELTVDSQQLITQYLNKRFDVAETNQQVVTLENVIGLTKDSYLPTLVLSYGQSFQFSDPFNENVADFEAWGDDQGILRIGLSWRLDNYIPGSQGWKSIEDNKDNLANMRLVQQTVKEGARMEILNLSNQLNEKLDALEPLELTVELAEKAFTLANEAYLAGSQEYLEVKDAELELEKAQLQVNSSKYDYISTLLDLEYAINDTLWKDN